MKRIVLSALCALLPSVALGQGTYAVNKNGCIVGLPCAYGVPLPPPPNQAIYAVDGDGCVIGQACPWRPTTKTTIDSQSRNVYSTRHNMDGTTDVFGSNPFTGSQWDKHIDPRLNLQTDHNKFGQERVSPLHTSMHNDTTGWAPSFVTEPVEYGHPRRQPWSNAGAVEREPASASSAQETGTSDGLDIAEYLAQQERYAAMAIITSQMRPGSIAEAARAAARQRCVAVADANARTACVAAANER
jgi:hypothetical protein